MTYLSRIRDRIYDDDRIYAVYMCGKLLCIGIILVVAIWMLAIIIGVTLPNMKG